MSSTISRVLAVYKRVILLAETVGMSKRYFKGFVPVMEGFVEFFEVALLIDKVKQAAV